MDAQRLPVTRTKRSLMLSLLLSVFVLAACRTQPGPAPTPSAAPTAAAPLIAFESMRDGNLKIYVIDD